MRQAEWWHIGGNVAPALDSRRWSDSVRRQGKAETEELTLNRCFNMKARLDLNDSAGKTKAKQAADKSSRSEPAPKVELTPAQQKKRAADKAWQLRERIARVPLALPVPSVN